MKENKCSMACAFRLAGCPRSTLRDFMAIAELKKVDSMELDLILHDQEVKLVRDLEVVCCKRLQCHILVMINMRREGQLLPMRHDSTVKYLVYFTTHKTAPLGATKSMKGYSCQCITRVGCCIKRKPKENIKVCVNVLPKSYQQVTDTLTTVNQQSADRVFWELFFTITTDSILSLKSSTLD